MYIFDTFVSAPGQPEAGQPEKRLLLEKMGSITTVRMCKAEAPDQRYAERREREKDDNLKTTPHAQRTSCRRLAREEGEG